MTLSIGPTDDLDVVRALRRTVFIEEQGVAEADEVDGRDGEALHILAKLNGKPIGTARLFLEDGVGKIGRVAVLADLRGLGYGKAVIKASLDVLRDNGMQKAKLGSQTHAIGFYEGLGFVAVGQEYIDAGIPHRDMVCNL